jgi:CRP-like cAMP-binding protein
MYSAPDREISFERIAILKDIPLFAGLRDNDWHTVINDFQLREYARNDIIFHQGDASHKLYIILAGKIRIFKISLTGNETSINIFSTGHIIGEFAAIDNQPRSATAKAIVDCVLLEIYSDHFLCHMRRMPDLALGMARTLAAKGRWTAAYAETLAQYDAAGRLLHILLLYNEQMGEAVEPGTRYVLDLALNQSDLASLVGTRRGWINRLLKDWQKRELIEHKNGKITILNLPAVEAERDSRLETS